MCNRKYQRYFRLFMLLLSGAFGVVSFSPYEIWPASIVSLTTLFTILLNSTYKQAIYYSFLWGIGFFGVGLHWIYISIVQFSNMSLYINIFLIILFIMYLALFPVLFAILLIFIQIFITTIWSLVSIIPILWLITEYLRGFLFTGFPWLQFGYTQIDGPLKGIAPILGVEGITVIITMISALLSISIRTIRLLPTMISMYTLLLLYPLQNIQWYVIQPQRTTRIALIQGNINQHVKWDTKYTKEILRIYLQHTLSVIKDAKIIIWPESAIPGNEVNYKEFLTSLDSQLNKYKTNVITGIISTCLTNNDLGCYNSIIVFGHSSRYQYPNYNRYNKHHLVLCAERFPCQRYIALLLNIPIFCMQQGNYLQEQLVVDNIKITASICYEMIFGNQIRDNFKFDTDFLLVVANNAWFGCSIEPWQYFQMARMRALELGRPLLCSTNNGITAIVDANGLIQAQIPQFISNVLISDVTPTIGLTPYARFGSWLLWSIIVCLFICIPIVINYRIIYLLKSFLNHSIG